MTARHAAGLGLALAGGAVLGLAVHAAGEASFRTVPLLLEVAAGIAVALVLWTATLVLRRDGGAR